MSEMRVLIHQLQGGEFTIEYVSLGLTVAMDCDIQLSSPASEITVSPGSKSNSKTGMVVPTIRLCMCDSLPGRAQRPPTTKR